MVDETLSHKLLMEGKFTPLKKMTKAELREEVEMWRNIWSWTPSAVKFYTSRTGSQVGVQVRNYHRFIGVLMETHWELKAVEVGVYEKVYDQNDGQYYLERKIVKIPTGQIVAFDWLLERTPYEEVIQELENDEEELLGTSI